MKRRTLETEKGKVAYWVSDPWEEGRRTLFFLHGLTADHTMFAFQEEYFSSFYNLILWDAPGHGKSRPYEDYSFGEAAEAIKGVLDQMGVGKVVFLGQSMGGFFVQAFLFRYPDRGEAFVSIDSCPYGDYYSRFDKWILRQMEWMSMLYPERLLKEAMAKQVALYEAGRQNMKKMLSPYGKKELCHLMGMIYKAFLEDNQKLTASVGSVSDSVASSGSVSSGSASFGTASAFSLRCPVLLLCGEKDVTGKVKSYNKAWEKRTGYPLLWIKGAAHNSNMDAPEVVNKAIHDFLLGLG